MRIQFNKNFDSVDNGVGPVAIAKSITILKALFMLKRAHFLLQPETIANCFTKADAPVLGNEPESVEEIPEISRKDFENFVAFDNEEATWGTLTGTQFAMKYLRENKGTKSQLLMTAMRNQTRNQF